jgi:predicted phage tail protein
VFEPSEDHNANVDGYVFEVLSTGGQTLMEHNIGKPPVVNGDCTVDVSALLRQLPAGTYVARVRALNAYGSSAPAASSPFTF